MKIEQDDAIRYCIASWMIGCLSAVGVFVVVLYV